MKIQIGEVQNLKGLTDLTEYIKQNIPFTNPDKRRSYSEEHEPLGAVIAKYGAVCRHMVGTEFSYLMLQGVDSKIVGTAKKINGESHSFLCVNIDNCTFLVDPVNNFLFPLNKAKEEIEKRGKPTKYHFPFKEFSFEFQYLPHS